MGRFLTKSRVTTCAIIVFICSIYCLDTADSHGHSHDHEHSQEPPSLKYSQQANQPPADAHASHGHSHGDHGHDHGHSHGAHDHGHTHGGKSHDHAHSQQPRKTVTKNTGVTLWIEAITATAIISVSPIFILLFIQLDHTEQYQSRLKVLLSFASGGLLGDAFLHLIPHATSPHSHGGDDSHSHSHGHSHEEGHSHDMSVGLWTLAGIIAFLIVEKFVRYVKGGHSHSHAPPAVKEKKEEKSKASGDKADDNSQKKDGKKDKEVTDKKTDEVKTDCSEVEDIKVAGYLNLAADFAHNFTDGLAIGASFLMGQNIGIVTTITIFLHEIPHEIGDFAILVQSGCSKKKAMMLQFSTAIGAMLGTICSLFAEGIGEAATAWILPFTAGGFIYIATVSVIPELLEDSKPGQSVKEILALLVGVYMMVLIGQYE